MIRLREKRKSGKGKCSFVALGRDEATRTPDPYVPNVVRYRDEATRTPDPYVPNVVRYQLRYIPIVTLSLNQQKVRDFS